MTRFFATETKFIIGDALTSLDIDKPPSTIDIDHVLQSKSASGGTEYHQKIRYSFAEQYGSTISGCFAKIFFSYFGAIIVTLVLLKKFYFNTLRL